jgi:hypothetical protein
MNTKNRITEKRVYLSPEIVKIMLDNEISLALESTPAEGPNEQVQLLSPHYFNTDPFKCNIG